jgi:hypothetical protein
MKISILDELDEGDVPKIMKAIISVDPDAKVAADVGGNTVNIDSWLFPEEFLVAFYDAGYDVRIAQR